MQAGDLLCAEIGARRVVGVGDDDETCALRYPGQHGIDIGCQLALRSGARCSAHRRRVDRIHQEAVTAVKHFVTGAGIAPQQQRNQFVGAGAANDPRGIDPVAAPERLPQLLSISVRIAVDLAGEGPVGGDCLAARPERALVRGEPNRVLDPGHLRFAANIGADVENARAGHQRRFMHHWLSPLWQEPAARVVPRSRRAAAAARSRHPVPRERRRGVCPRSAQILPPPSDRPPCRDRRT